MKYINIHSHQSDSNTSILNCHPNDVKNAIAQGERLLSIGLHPSYIQNDQKEIIKTIEVLANKKEVIAIGETGLDKICETDMDLQKEIFIQHIAISEKYKKPLIIHCVKAFNELMLLKKEHQPKMPWIIHAYRGNKQITEELLKKDFYFSFGKGIEHLYESISIIPFDRFFLETDDEDIDIKEKYYELEKLIHINSLSISHIIEQNFNNVFKIK